MEECAVGGTAVLRGMVVEQNIWDLDNGVQIALLKHMHTP